MLQCLMFCGVVLSARGSTEGGVAARGSSKGSASQPGRNPELLASHSPTGRTGAVGGRGRTRQGAAAVRVTYRSLSGIRIRAYLGIPIRGEGPERKLPCIVTAPGYGGSQQGVMLDDCQRGYAVLQVNPRSQGEPQTSLKKCGRITHRLPAARMQEAYELASQHSTELVGAVFRWS